MKQILILVHGMGNDADGPVGAADRTTWAGQAEALIRAASKEFPDLAQSELVVEPVLYDDVFQTHAMTWSALARQFVGTSLEGVTSWMKEADDGGFAWGSLGDVVQYRLLSPVREHVKTSVAHQIARIVSGHGVHHSYSIVAHSLGTAVAHDALQALATRSIAGNTALHPPGFVFSNFFALANVTRLVWATDERFYEQTRVRPPRSGRDDDECAVHHYASFRHSADPIASLVRFAPTGWDKTAFREVTLRHVRALNVHGLLHYLQSPRVVDRILLRLFPAQVTKGIRERRIARFADFVPPHERAHEAAVELVKAALDALTGKRPRALELELGALLEALEAIGATRGLPV
jgi:hypothetical protein